VPEGNGQGLQHPKLKKETGTAIKMRKNLQGKASEEAEDMWRNDSNVIKLSALASV
jgi:hypothetical protein